MSKYNNSYISYILNRVFYSITGFLLKKNENKFKKFKRKQKECIWCKEIHIKNSYFCSKKCKKLYDREKYQAFKHNNRCKYHKFKKLTYKNECWECYKENWIDNIEKTKIKNRLKLSLCGFSFIPTFRTSKDSWNGDKIAFEQNLLDNNVKWFIYIKFYVDNKGKARPIVIGKSGSSKVNGSGSDLNFSTAIKDGPARHFLHLNKYSWYYDIIAIKKCRSEQHAYKLERKYADKFDLFGS